MADAEDAACASRVPAGEMPNIPLGRAAIETGVVETDADAPARVPVAETPGEPGGSLDAAEGDAWNMAAPPPPPGDEADDGVLTASGGGRLEGGGGGEEVEVEDALWCCSTDCFRASKCAGGGPFGGAGMPLPAALGVAGLP